MCAFDELVIHIERIAEVADAPVRLDDAHQLCP
jgi:hypothetical protein